MSSSKKKKILLQLSSMQLKNIESSKKFTYRDIMRITKHINKSIFGKQCTLWDGFVANIKENKSPYINFYFRGKKLALHRLLYINYVEDLKPNEFIKYSCKNKGKCCCLNHMLKYVKENGNDNSDNNNDDNSKDNENNEDGDDEEDEDDEDDDEDEEDDEDEDEDEEDGEEDSEDGEDVENGEDGENEYNKNIKYNEYNEYNKDIKYNQDNKDINIENEKSNNIKELNKVNSKQENKKETNNKNKSFIDKISKFTICFD